MDFKGITWAGNIYQKFEAMCLEVEEVMYEDTAKYVENQVEKVGVCVKKFYAEIMEDLLPTSCSDPLKVPVEDFQLKPYAQTDINKKPKSSIQDIHVELEKKETKEEDISGLTAEESSLNVCNEANRLSLLSPSVPVENTRSEMCSAKSKKVGIYKRPIGIKRISKNNHPPKNSRAVTSSSSDGSNLLVYDMRSNFLVASDDMNVTRSSDFFVRNDHGEAATKHDPISDASVESSSSDQNISAETVRLEKNDPLSTSPATDKILLDKSLKQKKDDSECNLSCHGLPAEPIETFRKDCSLSQIKSDFGSGTCGVESVGEEVIVSFEDNFNVELIEMEDDLEARLELFEPVEKSKLEESCVLVESDKLHFVSPEIKIHKSYKKKIREAISSKLRSTRKQDQRVFQYQDLGEVNDTGMVTPVLTMDHDRRKSVSHEPCESDWELL